MNSFNHYAYGAVGDWMVQVMAGLNHDEAKPGYKHIVFKPTPGDDITQAFASYLSQYGLININWSLDIDNLKIDVTVPHNTTATLNLPPVGDIRGLKFMKPSLSDDSLSVKESDSGFALELGSGSYSMQYPLNKN